MTGSSAFIIKNNLGRRKVLLRPSKVITSHNLRSRWYSITATSIHLNKSSRVAFSFGSGLGRKAVAGSECLIPSMIPCSIQFCGDLTNFYSLSFLKKNPTYLTVNSSSSNNSKGRKGNHEDSPYLSVWEVTFLKSKSTGRRSLGLT